MSEKKYTAIYFSDLTNGAKDTVNLSEVISYVKSLQEVKQIWRAQENVLTDPLKFVKEIREKGIERIVVAGCKPGFAKNFFASVLKQAGKPVNEVILASFLEHGAVYEKDTDLAKAIVLCAVHNISFDEIAIPDEVDVNPDTLVIGGGIAGIQASLEIADGQQKVYLLEKSGTIGGHMAMFDKTFPTLDCAACILTPKMVEIGQHPNIELLTYSELQEVNGTPGNYQVKILKKARRVNVSTCIGCGNCAEKCPSTALSEFDANTSLRKAIYIPFPQAVPNKYLIDEKSCSYTQDPYVIMGATIKSVIKEGIPEEIASKLEVLKNKEIINEENFIRILNQTIGEEDANTYKDLIFKHTGKCKSCVKVCAVENCINLDEEDEIVELNVGNIILATGFQPFDASKATQFGYGKFNNVVTSLEFERLVNAAGPTGGNITSRIIDKKGNRIFTPDSEVPKNLALIHCIGSRDENHNSYCSRVCCMYSLKLAHLIKEKLPQAEVFEYFIDMRAYGKGYEEFYERIKKEGVHIIRGKTAIVEERNGKLWLRSEDILNQKIVEQEVDMVVLSVGLEPRKETLEIAKMIGIPVDKSGWLKELNYNSDPVNTNTGGINIAGVCQGPKDIPDTVAQASAAASRVLQSIVKKKIKKSIKDLDLKFFEEKILNY